MDLEEPLCSKEHIWREEMKELKINERKSWLEYPKGSEDKSVMQRGCYERRSTVGMGERVHD